MKKGPRARKVFLLVVASGVLALAASASQAAIGRGDGAESLAATFDAVVGLPLIAPCPALGPGGQKIEGRYVGTFTIPAEERRLVARFSLEVVFDRSRGVGTAEGEWQLAEPPDPDIVARGELLATVTGDPPGEVDPPDPDLALQGLLIGYAEPPDPDMPQQRLLANFTASLGEGATFPHLKGTVGDPSVGDPTGLESNTAVLVPAVRC